MTEDNTHYPAFMADLRRTRNERVMADCPLALWLKDYERKLKKHYRGGFKRNVSK